MTCSREIRGVVQTPVTVQRGFQPGLGWIVGLSARDFVRDFQPGLGWIVRAFVLLSSQAAPARWLPARTGAREEGAACAAGRRLSARVRLAARP